MLHNSKYVLKYNLKYLIKKNNLTQSEIAQKAKISTRTYQLIESLDANPTLVTIEELALALNTSASNLLRLNCIRVKSQINDFIIDLHNELDEFNRNVILRDLDGNILYSNNYIFRLRNISDIKLNNIYETYSNMSDVKGLLRLEFDTEKKGNAYTYTVPFPSLPNQEINYFRNHPTLVYLETNKHPSYALVYSTNIEDCDEATFYDYCKKVISIVEKYQDL